jgi:UDP-N-acetyl-2-amino-2-deoxyglucuronate dehydrogenase
MKKFALIGASGFVAPRHMKAIKDVGGDLVAAFDPADSVGVLDSHFPDARFFTEFERFDRHIDKLRRSGAGVDYVSICSPNYLHDAHVRFALRSGADAICEKPLVLNPWNLDGLEDMQMQTGQRVHTILQLRLHPAIIALKAKIDAAPADQVFDVDLTYITSRGAWYFVSWKGDEAKSGGIATNIGVHFYDMLSFVFGDFEKNHVHVRTPSHAAGYLEFKRARVRWFLSVDRNDLPSNTPEGQTTYRSITVDGDEVEFSGGFTDLHTLSYQDVLAGGSFGIDQVRPSIELVSKIRTCDLEPNKGEHHPFVQGKD